MSEPVWFYIEGESQQGPVSQEDLLSQLRRLPRETLVWREGLGDWQPAHEIAELGLRPAPPPPPPPASPPPPPRATAPQRPVVRTSAPAASARALGDEPPSYNPFVLWKRCFNWSGRFDRGEFAVAYFGQMFVTMVLFMGVGVVSALLSGPGRSGQDAGAVVTGIGVLLVLPFTIIIAFGSAVRRLHDIGQSGWLALLLLLPCVNFGLLIYLVAAQGQGGAAAGAASGKAMPALIIAAVVAVAIVPIIGIVAAIAIPSLLRARVAANEAGTIGDIRTVISAQAAYQSANGGYYGTITCLATPSGCIAGYNGPAFLDASLAQPQLTKNGYDRRWFETPARGRPGSVESFCYSATPTQQNQTGIRSFAGDGSGMIVFSPMGAACCTERGLDTNSCQPLR
jgi:type IV pilus assembly protein PilA